ncbi:hypothetical protein CC80DRAFT_546342 [Byssothecium circinans]|uniref:Uncharacterized protein n=1 Tax=Byssothecium circinans TaxID=147558 RepID=A0A6A5T9B2_9PLEO|nr:hypothetical protein CC80DRAFT_599745 [Byssothecium circinans]KAF1959029.1 hypothetical protein CC80DRAFT_546342 [Byssothecium circinans]
MYRELSDRRPLRRSSLQPATCDLQSEELSRACSRWRWPLCYAEDSSDFVYDRHGFAGLWKFYRNYFVYGKYSTYITSSRYRSNAFLHKHATFDIGRFSTAIFEEGLVHTQMLLAPKQPQTQSFLRRAKLLQDQPLRFQAGAAPLFRAPRVSPTQPSLLQEVSLQVLHPRLRVQLQQFLGQNLSDEFHLMDFAALLSIIRAKEVDSDSAVAEEASAVMMMAPAEQAVWQDMVSVNHKAPQEYQASHQ